MSARWIVVLTASLLMIVGVATSVLAPTLVPTLMPVGPAGIITEADDEFGSVFVYEVGDDGAISPEPTDPLTQKVWDLFTRTVGPDFAATSVQEFLVGTAPQSDTLAYVYRGKGPHTWAFAANLAHSRDHDLLVSTLIHEYGHIISLSPEEFGPRTASCPTVALDEGCLNDGAELLAFNQQFWSAYGSDAPAANADDEDAAWEFYLDHEGDFVSDYAATNVVEDFAETFSTFVLEPQPTDDATMVAKKLNFFWSYPEFVAIRERLIVDLELQQ